MENTLSLFLDTPVTLIDQAVIQLGGYDMDYYELATQGWQILVYRSHKNPVVTKVILVKDRLEFNYSLPDSKVSISHFLEYYLSLKQLTNSQLSLITGYLEEVSYYLRYQAQFYQTDFPANVKLLNVFPQPLVQALRDYELLIKLITKYQHKEVVQLFLNLNISVASEYSFLSDLPAIHKRS